MTTVREGPSAQLATAGADGTVRVWRRGDFGIYETAVGFYPYDLERVNAIAWSPHGNEIATAGENRSVRIWDVTTTRQPATLHGQNGYLTQGSENQLIFNGQPLSDDELTQLGRQRTFRQLTAVECGMYLHSLWIPWCPSI